MKTSRLEILTASLAKKRAAFDRQLSNHMGDVRSANSQPLNDKRNGMATLRRWDKQNDALHNARKSIEITEQAIEREQAKIDACDGADLPQALRAMVESGELIQWRKHPHTFFVPGVDRGRIVWVPSDRVLGCRYHAEIPKEQYPTFRAAFYKAKEAVAA